MRPSCYYSQGFIVQWWSHQQGSIVVGIWSWLKLRKSVFLPSFKSVLVMVCQHHPICLCLDSEDDYSTGCRNVSHCQQHSTERTYSTYLSSDSWVQTFTVLRSLGRQSEQLANHKNPDTEDDYCRGCQPACEEDILSRLASLGINGELAHRLVVETSVKKK